MSGRKTLRPLAKNAEAKQGSCAVYD